MGQPNIKSYASLQNVRYIVRVRRTRGQARPVEYSCANEAELAILIKEITEQSKLKFFVFNIMSTK